MKSIYRRKIASALTTDKRIDLNIAYDYLSDPKRRECYNLNDITKLKKYEFDFNMLIIKNEKQLLKRIIDDCKKLEFNMNHKGQNKMSLLYMASRCGDRNLVAMLLDSGSDPSEAQGNGSTSLHVAAFYGHKDIVKLLLEVGVDADIKNQFGNLAEEESYSEEIKKLIQNFRKKDLSYKFFKENYKHFKDVKLVFNNKDEYIGKRAMLEGKKCVGIWPGTARS